MINKRRLRLVSAPAARSKLASAEKSSGEKVVAKPSKRREAVLELIRSKQDEHGRWALEYDYPGKTWLDFGNKKQPNKWVTLRALEVLKGIN